jgi:ADP-ribosyltransferase exoenzyme
MIPRHKLFLVAVTMSLFVSMVGCKAHDASPDLGGSELLSVGDEIALCPAGPEWRVDDRILANFEDNDEAGLAAFTEAVAPFGTACGSDASLHLAPTPGISRVIVQRARDGWRILTKFNTKGDLQRTFTDSRENRGSINHLLQAATRRLSASSEAAKRAFLDIRQIRFANMLAMGGDQLRLPTGKTINPATYRLEAPVEKSIAEWYKKYADDSLGERFSYARAAAEKSGLSLAEFFGIYFYTSKGYVDFVDYFSMGEKLMRSGQKLDGRFFTMPLSFEMVDSLFRAAISGFNKLPVSRSSSYFGATMPIDDILPNLKVGAIFRSQNFTSTTAEREVALGYAGRNLAGEVAGSARRGYGSFLFKVENGTKGASVAQLSNVPGESEVLFRPNHPFRVKSITKVNGDGPAAFDVVLTD